MENAYCGKNCAACPGREQHRCPGCGQGACGYLTPGSDCPIVKCCKRQEIPGCAECKWHERCHVYDYRAQLPITRLHTKQKAMAQQIHLAKQLAPKLTALCVLFVIQVVLTVFSAITGDEVISEETSTFLNTGIWIVYGLVLLLSTDTHARFLGASALNLGALFLTWLAEQQDGFLMVFLLLCSVAAIYLGLYYELTACARIVQFHDPILAIRWQKLWRWCIWLSCLSLFVYLFVVSKEWNVVILLLVFVLAFWAMYVWLQVLRVQSIRLLKSLTVPSGSGEEPAAPAPEAGEKPEE